jgi:hypothetical protein
MKRLGYCAGSRASGGFDMQRVDGAYLYELGANLRPVLALAEEDTDMLGRVDKGDSQIA